MLIGRLFPRRFVGNLLLVAGTLLPTPNLTGQTAPAQIGTAAESQLPDEVLAKLDKLQADLKTAQGTGDAGSEAKALNGIGDVYTGVSRYQEALGSYNQALTLARSAKDAPQQAAALNGIANCYGNEPQNDKALELYQQALDLATASGDLRGQATALNGLALIDHNLGQNQKALDYLNRALPLAQHAGDRDLEATILRRTGIVYSGLGEQQKALDLYDQALPIYRAVGDGSGEARTLNNIGTIYNVFGQQQKALDYYNQALPILREIGDRGGEANALTSMGAVYSDLGENQKALDFYNQALPIYRAVGGRNGEVGALVNIGAVYFDLGEKQKALDYYNRALPILREVGNRSGEAVALNDISNVYSALGQQQKALDYYNQALPAWRAVGDRRDEASTLNNIGKVYFDLGEKEKALDYFKQALPIRRAVSDRGGEATTLTSIGVVYTDMGERQKALDYFSQALPIFRAVGDRGGEAITLDSIAGVYDDLGEKQKALDYYNQALSLDQAAGDGYAVAGTLNNIAKVYHDLGEKKKALDYYNQALPLAIADNDPLTEAVIFYDLADDQRDTQPALAIFYGKQAVNSLQQVRGNIQGLDKELQGSFLASKARDYHDLADLLIEQGRLQEAQEVLNLLKEHEYSDYAGADTADAISPLTLTPAEKQAQEDYRKSAAQLALLEEQREQLKRMNARTPEQEKQYRQLSNQRDAETKGLNDFFARLSVLFGKGGEASKQVANVKGDVDLLKQAIAKLPHTVAIYTLVGKDRTRLVVITGAATVAREYVIPEADLDKMVAEFEEALRNPARDPRPISQSLYKIMIAPVKADLDQAGAETLVWSLDGVLRYVPMAALFDGKNYLVEKYNMVTITPASIPHLAEKPDVSNLSAVAMGISHGYEDNLPPLPAVAGELNDVVKDPQVPGADGVLPGTILLNGQFTEKAMETQLGSQHAVVHIATHFVFRPGDDSQSYLLLAGKDDGGGGYHLTLADFRENKNLPLRHTELLTLSACETGIGGKTSNGRDVDGLGMTAQRKGAKAVISSLWSVNDASTGILMGDFYKRWAEGAGNVTKVEALRQAQLDLLRGRVKPQAGDGGRGFGTVHPDQNAPSGYAHPYYWAPFVLMGNWR